jgi:hypothetical protein
LSGSYPGTDGCLISVCDPLKFLLLIADGEAHVCLMMSVPMDASTTAAALSTRDLAEHLSK